MANAKKEMTFEEKIKRLESIVNELESGEVNLDDAIAKYTEAMKLSKECSDKLTEVTEKVNKILNENGKLEDFEVKEQKLVSMKHLDASFFLFCYYTLVYFDFSKLL